MLLLTLAVSCIKIRFICQDCKDPASGLGHFMHQDSQGECCLWPGCFMHQNMFHMSRLQRPCFWPGRSTHQENTGECCFWPWPFHKGGCCLWPGHFMQNLQEVGCVATGGQSNCPVVHQRCKYKAALLTSCLLPSLSGLLLAYWHAIFHAL